MQDNQLSQQVAEILVSNADAIKKIDRLWDEFIAMGGVKKNKTYSKPIPDVSGLKFTNISYKQYN